MKKSVSLMTLILMVLIQGAFAQSAARPADPRWEVLEVKDSTSSRNEKRVRSYRFVTSGVEVEGPASLEWIQQSGWELSGTKVTDGGNFLLFKRRFEKKRTESEIARLKKDAEVEQPVRFSRAITDLDSVEAAARLQEFNRNEEAKFRAVVEKIDGLSLTVREVVSRATEIGKTRVGAVIVIDATKELLKDGKNYRSSEAEKFYVESSKRIAEALDVTLFDSLGGQAVRIGQGNWSKPELGRAYTGPYEFALRIAVVIKAGGEENIVALGNAVGRNKTPKP